MKKEDLIEEFEYAIKNKITFVMVVIENKNYKNHEWIFNPNENFKDKLEYYKNAYDDNLVLKNCKDIRIISCYSFNEFKID